MATQRVRVSDIEQAPSLRSMSVGTYGVAVQRVSGDESIRSFLKSFEGLTDAGVRLEQAQSKEQKDLAEAEVAKMTPEQLRKLQKGIPSDVPMSSNPYTLKYAQMAAGELAMREGVGGRVADLARQGVRSGGDVYEGYAKASQDVFSGLGSGYMAVGAKRIKEQYDNQFESYVAQETERLTQERISAKLNSDIAALTNRLTSDGFNAENFKTKLRAIHLENASAGVSIQKLSEAISTNISRIEDPDIAKQVILASQETVLDSGLTLGTAIPQDAWDAMENKVLSEEQRRISVESGEVLTIDTMRTLNEMNDMANAIGDDALVSGVKSSIDDSKQQYFNSILDLPDVDNSGSYTENVSIIESAISQGNTNGAVAMLDQFVVTGKITKPEYQRLVRSINDAFSLRNVVSNRVENVAQGLRVIAGVDVQSAELEDVKAIYRRNLLSSITEYRKDRPNATNEELRTALGIESGIVSNALKSTGEEISRRDSAIQEEKNRVEQERMATEQEQKKKLDLNIPWASANVDALNKASTRRYSYVSRYETNPTLITDKEKYGFEKLYKWETDKAFVVAKEAANALNTGVFTVAGAPIPQQPLGEKGRQQFIEIYSTAKNSIGYTYAELINGTTADGISIDSIFEKTKPNYFQTLVVKDKKELDEISKDNNKLQVYKDKLGVVNTKEFIKRQDVLLKLTGKM